MILRPYQREAVDAVYHHLRTRDDNPCVVLPTAAGKTPVMATICRDAVHQWDGRVAVVSHVKELIEQTVDKIKTIAPDLPVGVCSAGLRRKDLDYAVTVAGIQSIWKRAADLGRVDLLLIDECHLIPLEDDGMYRSFIADAKVVNPNLRVVGLTATPYRMKSGTICAPDAILNHVCYEIGVRELIVQGYLCPLRTKAGAQRPDFSGLHVRAGEFVAGEVETLMDGDGLVDAACREILHEAADRRSILIFAAGVEHGRHVVDSLAALGVECGFVTAETPAAERIEIVRRFRDRELRCLANVSVFTTGFDAPNVDCVVLLRPTMSPGLFYQCVGRGFRLHPDKHDCLVLDFGGNVLRHGPVDLLSVEDRKKAKPGAAAAKECPQCHELIATGYQVCPRCGHAFPPRERERHEAQATAEGILSGQVTRETERVHKTSYHFHTKRDNPDAPPTMRVEYRVGFQRFRREWICFEHEGYARRKAEQWWQARSSEPVPKTVEEAVDLANMGALCETLAVTIEKRAGELFERVVSHELGPRPPRLDSEEGLPEPKPKTSVEILEEEFEIPF